MKHMLGSIEPNLNPKHNWIDTRTTRSKLSSLMFSPITQGYSRWNTVFDQEQKLVLPEQFEQFDKCTTVCTKHRQVPRKHVYPPLLATFNLPVTLFGERSCRYPWPLLEGTDKLGKPREKKQFLMALLKSAHRRSFLRETLETLRIPL